MTEELQEKIEEIATHVFYNVGEKTEIAKEKIDAWIEIQCFLGEITKEQLEETKDYAEACIMDI